MGHRPRLQPSAGLLSRQRGLECLLTRQVSLSFSYAGGLNEGSGWPGLGENHRLPLSLPFSGDQVPAFSQARRLRAGSARPPHTSQDAKLWQLCPLCPGQKQQLLPLTGVSEFSARSQARVLLPGPTEIPRIPQISLNATPEA